MQGAAKSVQSRQVFDVIVVGSGATGGWAAKKLTEAGLNVALLEAGRRITAKDFSEHMQPWDVPFLNLAKEHMAKERPIQTRCGGCNEFNHSWFVNDLENPY